MSRALTELVYGKGAHAHPLASVDVPFEIARRQPPGMPRTIWQLVWHMNYWMHYELEKIDGRNPRYPEHAALSWPEPEPPDAAAWSAEQARFRKLLEQYVRRARGDAAELGRPVASTDPARAGERHSVEEILWQMVSHNSYHLGQVVLVRQALGAWPPPSGADTW